MSRKKASLLDALGAFFDDDEPEEPAYDPVHLGGAALIAMTAIGALYWLLWTLLVFEGGLQGKLVALARLAGGATLKDLGWVGYPYEMGAFQGALGNIVALGLSIGLIVAAKRLYDASPKVPRQRRGTD